ncbi:MAG: YigZ family protein [Lachnospiraceae bacterium]|nr:YigZ family protein [Lachnospiraceae bacterium]
MVEKYKILYRGGQGELVEKKSRFIATARPVKTEEEAAAFVEEMKKKYWDARHNCYAYVLGERGETCRCSDDGEPAQTAGRPMLDVLLGEGVRDVCVVVTRYFGGTLLGTGGLVRAYSGAVQEGLRHSLVAEKILGRKLLVSAGYSDIGKIQYVAGQMGLTPLGTEYGQQVVTTLIVPEGQAGRLIARITERTNGKAVVEEAGKAYYAVLEGEVVML